MTRIVLLIAASAATIFTAFPQTPAGGTTMSGPPVQTGEPRKTAPSVQTAPPVQTSQPVQTSPPVQTAPPAQAGGTKQGAPPVQTAPAVRTTSPVQRGGTVKGAPPAKKGGTTKRQITTELYPDAIREPGFDTSIRIVPARPAVQPQSTYACKGLGGYGTLMNETVLWSGAAYNVRAVAYEQKRFDRAYVPLCLNGLADENARRIEDALSALEDHYGVTARIAQVLEWVTGPHTGMTRGVFVNIEPR